MAVTGLHLRAFLCQLGAAQHNILLVITFFILVKSGKQTLQFLELLQTESKVHGLNL